MKVHHRDLVPGVSYRIQFDDCCIDGFVATAKFVRSKPFSDGSGEGNEVLEFDGMEFTRHRGCEFFVVSE